MGPWWFPFLRLCIRLTGHEPRNRCRFRPSRPMVRVARQALFSLRRPPSTLRHAPNGETNGRAGSGDQITRRMKGRTIAGGILLSAVPLPPSAVLAVIPVVDEPVA